jgi:hypothetical protein
MIRKQFDYGCASVRVISAAYGEFILGRTS